MNLDFDAVDTAALPHAPRLLNEWVGGKQEGHEWVAAKKSSGGPGDSLKFNTVTGRWAQFSGDAKGPGLVSFCAHVKGIDKQEAVRLVAEAIGYAIPRGPAASRVNGAHYDRAPAGDAPRDNSPPDHSPRVRAPAREEAPAVPVPSDAGMPPPHPKHGLAESEYPYYDASGSLLFVVCRYPLPEPPYKTFCPWTWRRERWSPVAYPAPRVLYGLQNALARPTAPVLVVEGEKCADIANAVLSGYVSVTWASGASSVKHADWSPLAGRDVHIWPDADKPGREAAAKLAAILLALGCRVRVLTVDDRPEGWDIADAVGQGLKLAELLSAAHWREVPAATRPAVPVPKSDPASLENEFSPSASLIWSQSGVVGSGKSNDAGIPHPTASNVARILKNAVSFGREIWQDDFRSRIYFTTHGVSRPWTDSDDLLALKFIQQVALLPKVGLQTVVTAVQLLAVENRRNSVQQYLQSLKWDGTPRLEHWTIDFLGTPNTAYTRAVARNWLISMVARAMHPGCQADHMPVLEGHSGRGKSSALAILGGEWYVASAQEFGGKAFLEIIQGAWLIEIPDMAGFGKREHGQVIAAMTTRSDRYRAAYGRNAADHPRTCIFAATSETNDYLADTRGTRRYWPLVCTDIQLEALAAARDQLFAEAFHAYQAGATWFEMPAKETVSEQMNRQQGDIWLDSISQYVASRERVSISEVAMHCLNIETGRQTQPDANRIAKCLRILGYIVVVAKNDGRSARIYRRIPE